MRVVLIGGHRLDKIQKPLESVGVECITINTLNIITAFKILDKQNIDLIITDTPGMYIIMGYVIKRILKVPLVYRMRGNYWQEVESEGRFPRLRVFIANRILFKLCDAIIPMSNYLKEEIKKRLNFSTTIDVVELPVDTNNSDKYRNIYDKSDLRLITLTNLNYIEKIKPILKYANIINEILNNVGGKWYIAGKGKYAEFFRNTIKKYGNIEYCGFVNSTDFLKEGDIMLHFSEFEAGIPNAILEGIVAGLPVIVNDFKPISEFKGVIVIKNENELKESIYRLLLNVSLRKKIVISNKKLLIKHNQEVIGQKYIKIFQKIINSKRY